MVNPTATKCWTCRRRRVKCDGRRPVCLKCSILGRECLGYGEKPLIWAGIASRGKMSGKTFDQLERDRKLISSAPKEKPQISTPRPQEQRHRQHTPPTPTPPPQENLNSCESPHSGNLELQLFRPLVDPGLSDLSTKYRSYIRYYEEHCCKECIIYDESENRSHPHKELIALIPNSPIIFHAIVSVAAYHQAFRRAGPSSLSDEWLVNHTIEVAEDPPPQLDMIMSSVEYKDALWHKQKAIFYLKDFVTSRKFDVVAIASILLIMWTELYESDHQSWKFHFNGMGEMMRYQKSIGALSLDLDAKSPFDRYVQETFLVFNIFATISCRTQRWSSLFPEHMIDDLLKHAELHSWTGCPAELLRILYAINSLSSNPDPSSDDIIPLLNRLEQFSPSEWANNCKIGSVQQRCHLASAYKTAVEMFASRVLLRPNVSFPECIVDAALNHLSSIDTENTYFKCLPWPAFVVGMEAHTVEQRRIVMRIFMTLYNVFHTSHIRLGMIALQNIWVHASSEGTQQAWRRYFEKTGYEFLMV